jgi:phytoene dehydrogenase-like protein
MNPHDHSTDVVVVGGGLAGLSAACYLGRAGVAVTLFEQAAELGGRAATRHEAGYSFNRGIHALYSGGPAEQVLQELGVSYSSGIPKGVYALRQGRLYAAPFDPGSLIRTDLLSTADKLELVRVLATASLQDAQKLGRLSIAAWMDRHVRRPAVRQVMEATACTFVYSTALDLVSADAFIIKLQRALAHPVRYIDGGWQTLVDGLRQKAEQASVRIVRGVHVAAVAHEGGHVCGVRLRDGSLVPATAVLIATRPAEAVKLVDERAHPALRRIVDALTPAHLACLDVALRRLPDPRHPIVQDLDRPRFMTTQSLFAQMAPKGGALISAFKQLDPRQPSDPHADERDLEQLLDAVQPGWREVLVRRVYLPHIEASGSLPLAARGGYAGRPQPQVPDMDGVYLAGDWVGDGFLADASMHSARMAAQLIVQRSRAASPAREPLHAVETV